MTHGFVCSLALNCENSRYEPMTTNFRASRPSLDLYAVSSFEVAYELLEQVSATISLDPKTRLTRHVLIAAVYRDRSSAVKVAIFMETVLQSGSSLPESQAVYRLLNVVKPALAEGIQQEDMWDQRNNRLRPWIELEIGVEGDGRHWLEVDLGIQYSSTKDEDDRGQDAEEADKKGAKHKFTSSSRNSGRCPASRLNRQTTSTPPMTTTATAIMPNKNSPMKPISTFISVNGIATIDYDIRCEHCKIRTLSNRHHCYPEMDNA